MEAAWLWLVLAWWVGLSLGLFVGIPGTLQWLARRQRKAAVRRRLREITAAKWRRAAWDS